MFKHDPEFEANEQKYQAVKKEIIGDESSGSGSGSDGDDSGDDESEEEEEKGIFSFLSKIKYLYLTNPHFFMVTKGEDAIVDETETNLIALRRTIYLTIQSSLDHNECAHKMMKMQMKPGQEPELCHMILDCCAQQRTYEKFFGLLAQVLTPYFPFMICVLTFFFSHKLFSEVLSDKQSLHSTF